MTYRHATTHLGDSSIRYVDRLYQSGSPEEKNVPGHVEFHEGIGPCPSSYPSQLQPQS